MSKFRLRRGTSIGSLAAENDTILEDVFLDLGYVQNLVDTAHPYFLVVGRTGSGKTALLEHIKANYENVSTIDPENLSMQYLHSSTILKILISWGVNLEIFYKFLWRHVCILELLRLRYADAADIPGKILNFFDITIFKPNQRRTRELAQAYLETHGSEYWERTDTHIKNITTEMETRLKSNADIAAKLGGKDPAIEAKGSTGSEEKELVKVEKEIVNRAQNIVSDYLISDLNQVVDLISKYGFTDPQRKYYIIIDDLDKNWMPDDALYLSLVKSLLATVSTLNRQIKNVKVIVALRENIYHRVFNIADRHDPQREKLSDVILRVNWDKRELIDMLDRRLEVVFRGQYTSAPPTVAELLPKRTKVKPSGLDYVVERSLKRPRDLIHFMRVLIPEGENFSRFVWKDVQRAEAVYSKERLDAIIDEWKDSFRGITATFRFLKEHGKGFSFSEFSDQALEAILSSSHCEQCPWLSTLRDEYVMSPSGEKNYDSIKRQILDALYLTGMIGIMDTETGVVTYSNEKAFDVKIGDVTDRLFVVHKMLLSGLGISQSVY